MTRLRKIFASIEGVIKSIEQAGYGKSLVSYIDKNGDGFYISYTKKNKPKAKKDEFIRTLFLFSSSDPSNPIAQEEIGELDNIQSTFQKIEQKAIDKLGKADVTAYERKVLMSQTKDFAVPADNEKWEQAVDEYLGKKEEIADSDLVRESYNIMQYFLDQKDGKTIELSITYDESTQNMCLIRDDNALVTKKRIENNSEAQAVYNSMVQSIIKAGQDLMKDNNLQNLQTKEQYSPKKLGLSFDPNSSEWVGFCAEFGRKQQEDTKKMYEEKNKKNNVQPIDETQIKTQNKITSYRSEGVAPVAIYYVGDALALYDTTNKVVIASEFVEPEGDYLAAFEKLETKVLDIIKDARQEKEGVYRDINNSPPITIDVSVSKPWQKFQDQEQKAKEKAQEENSQQPEQQPENQDNMVVDEVRTREDEGEDVKDKKLPKRRTYYPNQKSQRETTTIEIRFEDTTKSLGLIRRFIKDMIDKKYDFNYSITDVTANTFNGRKVMAMINKICCPTRLRKVAFNLDEQANYVSGNVTNRHLAFYFTSDDPTSNPNSTVGMIFDYSGKFLAIANEPQKAFRVIEQLVADKVITTWDEGIECDETNSLKIFGDFEEAERWIVDQVGNTYILRWCYDSKYNNTTLFQGKQDDNKDNKTEEDKPKEEPKKEEPKKEEPKQEEPKKEDEPKEEPKKEEPKEKPKLKKLRMHYVPTDSMTKYINDWLAQHSDIVKNGQPLESAAKLNKVKERMKHV